MGKKETSGSKPKPAIKVQPKSKAQTVNTDSYKKFSYQGYGAQNAVDHTYVYNPKRSLVGTGGLKLQLKNGLPEFKGFIIFINGFWGDPVKNTGAVAWNTIMDKVPERGDPYSMKGAENTNEKDQTDADDRYTPEEYKKDTASPVKHQIMESIKNGVFPARGIFMLFHATKFERFAKYWNVKENNYKFTERYAEHFDAKDNIHYLNGSHGLQSDPGHRIDHGFKQGQTWAKLNLHYLEKPTYDTFSKYMPGLPSPEYNPITIVMHSQGNAFGVGVAKGILKYLADLKWDKAAINMVYLALHQNIGYKYDAKQKRNEYDIYKETKLDMLANKPMKAKLAEFFEKNKLNLINGIDDYSKKKISDWDKLKTRGVQFTFSNDRSDAVSRMGDIPGIANACNSDGDDVHFTPFELAGGSYKIYSKHIMNKLLEFLGVEEGKVLTNSRKTKFYTDLVAAYSKAYYAYKKLKADIDAGRAERYTTTVVDDDGWDGRVSVTTDNLVNAEGPIIYAYSDLFDAELAAHSGPIAWGLHGELMEWSNGKSVFQLVTEKGANIFYRKVNKKANLLINPLLVH